MNDDEAKMIRVTYEIPPLRAVYFACYLEDGRSEQELRDTFQQIVPRGRIRKIERNLPYGERDQ